jgi:UDP-N-acetylmuramyl pentapeptide phosphotransferase/UDP-N-acetylglucosamine-1-phosphate transferase
MDGINGISGVEAISISGGLLAYCFYGPTDVPLGYPLLLIVVMAGALGFLVWNGRSVAKIFLGDVGSIGFGYCLGFLLFVFAAQGHIIPAVLVALVYCMDATTTLLKQLWHRKKIWESRREHYYHRATVKGALTHFQAIGVIAVVNIILIAIGLTLLRGMLPPFTGLALGIIIVAAMMMRFYYIGFKNGHVSTPRGEMYGFQIRINKFMRRFFH